MLIEFRVGNYRSIATPQSLLLVASTDDRLAEDNVAKEGKARLLRQSVIYGANAAGKSNLLMSMEALRSLVMFSADLQEGQPLPWVTPFRLNPANEVEPSTFEVIFEENGVRYHYALAATVKRVVTEWLVAYPRGRPQRWFERSYDPNKNAYNWWFGASFHRSHSQRELWQISTRSNASFLSTAVKLNNEQLKPVFHWLTQKLIVILPGKVGFNPALSLDLLRSDSGQERMMKFLKSADIGIDRLELQENDGFPPTPLGIQPAQWAMMMPMSPGASPKVKWAKVVSWHTRMNGNPIMFEMQEESDGTNKLFEFIGGWIRALDIGATLCVDEIDRSLHPLLTRMLVRLFCSGTNRNNGQLIFTTHDTTLLDPELLRRDQVWFVEKNTEQATTLYPLLDYSPRKNENLERGYLLGRYGAIPFVGDLHL